MDLIASDLTTSLASAEINVLRCVTSQTITSSLCPHLLHSSPLNFYSSSPLSLPDKFPVIPHIPCFPSLWTSRSPVGVKGEVLPSLRPGFVLTSEAVNITDWIWAGNQ